MVDGIGIDIVETARIARAIENPRFLARVFTPHEAADCASRGRAAVAPGRVSLCPPTVSKPLPALRRGI